jgi:hypothetical protein
MLGRPNYCPKYPTHDVLKKLSLAGKDLHEYRSAAVVRVPRYGLEAVLAYQNYRLDVFLPDSMLASR